MSFLAMRREIIRRATEVLLPESNPTTVDIKSRRRLHGDCRTEVGFGAGQVAIACTRLRSQAPWGPRGCIALDRLVEIGERDVTLAFMQIGLGPAAIGLRQERRIEVRRRYSSGERFDR